MTTEFEKEFELFKKSLNYSIHEKVVYHVSAEEQKQFLIFEKDSVQTRTVCTHILCRFRHVHFFFKLRGIT